MTVVWHVRLGRTIGGNFSLSLRNLARQSGSGIQTIRPKQSTARSFRDGTPIYCPLRRTWSLVFTPSPLEIQPWAVAWQSITLPLCLASSTIWANTLRSNHLLHTLGICYNRQWDANLKWEKLACHTCLHTCTLTLE